MCDIGLCERAVQNVSKKGCAKCVIKGCVKCVNKGLCEMCNKCVIKGCVKCVINV